MAKVLRTTLATTCPVKTEALLTGKTGVQITAQGKRKTPRSEDLRVFPWLGRKNLFQTLEQQDEVEIEQEIKEIRALLDESDRSSKL